MTRSIILNKKLKSITFAILTAVFWLSVWQVASMWVNDILLVVPPLTVFLRLFELCSTLRFWSIIGASLLRLAAGFALGVSVGVLLAVLCVRLTLIERLVAPLMNIIRTMPVASFIIFLLVWTNNETIPIITAFIMVLPIVWGNLREGIRSTDRSLLQMAQVFELSAMRRVREIYFPTVRPFLNSAVITSIGLSWKAGIAAEVLCQPQNSIGKMIQGAKVYLETPDLFAWTLAVILLSMLLERLLVRLLKRRSAR